MDNIAFSESESNNCSCIGDTLTFECTVIRGVGIIWRGTAFNCPSIGNEIYLLETSISVSTCNKGMVTGRIVRVRENNYTSQLNVTLGSDLIGQTVECAYDDGTGSQIIANRTLDILCMCGLHHYDRHVYVQFNN